MKQKINRVGEENYNNFGTLMKIIIYNDVHHIAVEFQDKHKYKVYTRYQNFKKGEVKNPYDKIIYSIGFLGEGKYNKKDYELIYITWKNMLQRCYDPYELNKHPTYINCYVCDEWHNFQNFAKWYENNYYECNGEKMCLDKDILIKENKIYSPQTCIFVPQRINSLFTKRQNDRGKYPIGVRYDKKNKILTSQCNIIDESGNIKRKHLGSFSIDKPFQAFTCYKQFKENYIKEVADKYKNLIPIKLYKALYNYRVEIND